MAMAIAIAPVTTVGAVVRSKLLPAVHLQHKGLPQRSVVRCTSRWQPSSSSCGSGEEAQCRSLKLSGVVAPLLAAAVVGSAQPAVQAAEWEKYLVPVIDNTETPNVDPAYRELLQKIKEKRQKQGIISPSAPIIENTNRGASSYAAPPPVAAPKTQDPPAAKSNRKIVKEEPAKVEVLPAQKAKTHGFLPLFLSQLLLLGGTVYGGYILIITPQSKWDELRKKAELYLEKASPVVEDVWTKAQPVAAQAGKKATEFAELAKPYVKSAWEASKPLAAKAFEASKPILKDVQVKASELLQQAQEKTK